MMKKSITIILSGIFLAVGIIIYVTNLPYIVFTTKQPKIEINEEFDPYSIIQKVRKESMDDIIIDDHELNCQQLGTYTVRYSLLDKTYEIKVTVEDTIAPVFDVVSCETDAQIPVDPYDMVTNIQDATKTVVSFKEDYSFDQEKDLEVILVVCDEAGNCTEKTSFVHILPKDEIAPLIMGEENITLYVGSNFDPMNGMSVTDNQDPSVKLTILSNQVNLNQPGTYQVIYQASDRSHNTASFTKTVKVIKKENNKIVYLTFDDGPSYNTPKVLKILDQYHVKATFFVTGQSTAYRDAILQAYQAGHTIGLHTYSHKYNDVYASVNAYFQDLEKISQVVESITGYKSKYIRFPGGSSNTVSKKYSQGIMSVLSKEVCDRGYQYFDWNISSSDASGSKTPVSQIISSSCVSYTNEIMILFHDTYGKDTTVEALPSIIEYYLDRGYTFKAIDESTSGFHHGINN